MRIGRVSHLVSIVAVLVLGATGVANASTARVSGTITEVSPGTCGDFVLRGQMLSLHCEGLVDAWAGGISGSGVFDEAVSLNLVSGAVQVSGAETFDGCVGVSCGTLEWTYHGSGRIDLATFAVVFINGEQHFTGGTGGLEEAKGSLRFSLIGAGPATYEGSIVL